MMKMDLSGLDRVLTTYNRGLDELASGEVFEAAAKTHRMPLVVAARDECPKQTGALAASIRTEIANATLTLTATEDYASFVHDGTKTQTANPFLERAVARTSEDLAKRIETEARKRFK